jgi:microcin C transport system substrate-binding protein
MPRSVLLSLALVVCISGCSTPKSENPATASAPASAPSNANVSLNKNDYPVFANSDAGADPSVPAELGGKGFKGEGWETNTDFDLIGDPRALKGGTLRDHMISFPGTLRMAGPEWNSSENYVINSLVYETLLGLHPTTLQYIPVLASHWKIEPDKLTFRFRIDPNARFSDGTPVTTEDVLASYKFFTDKTLQDLFYNTELNKLEPPVAESKYIVRFKAKELGWQNFLVASGALKIFPAHVIKNIDGAAYLRDYNFKLLPGSGPYILSEADIEKGRSITLRRRKDYWAQNYRANIGQYNIDEYKRVVVRDENLAIEMMKKGELDYYFVAANPQVWVERFNIDAVQRGLLVKRSVFNNYPAPVTFLGFNMRRKPYDDIRVRKALALLFNREQMIEKLFYGLYKPIYSYYPATVYENPTDPKITYNPEEALKLLAEAGWKDRDSQGRLIKNGQPLQIELLYARQVFEPWLTVYQEDLRKVGISLNLRLVTFETAFKLEMQRQFDYTVSAWGAGSVFPDPKPEYYSATADIENTNNISGFKDKQADALMDEYDATFDANKRVEILKKLDGILANSYQYTLRWYDPAQRIVFWNKFGMPQGTFSRVGDYEGTLGPGIPQLWWVDPQKSQRVAQAMRDNSIKLDISPEEDHYWQERYGQAQKEMEAQTKKQ